MSLSRLFEFPRALITATRIVTTHGIKKGDTWSMRLLRMRQNMEFLDFWCSPDVKSGSLTEDEMRAAWQDAGVRAWEWLPESHRLAAERDIMSKEQKDTASRQP
jgi:hypothetical protein